MSSAYITEADLKAVLKIKGEHADEAVALAVVAASEGLDAEYNGGRPFTGGEPGEVRYFSPVLKSQVTLGAVSDITEVAIDETGDGTYATALLEADYRLAPSTAPHRTLHLLRTATTVHRLTSRYGSNDDRLRVTGTFGYDEPPEGLRVAALIVGERLVQRMMMAPFGVIQIGPEGQSTRAQAIARDPEVRFAMRPVVGPRRLVY